jgi:hypothetical protein
MTWINSAFTYADAQARVHPTWDLYVTEWGDFADPAAVTLAFPVVGKPGLPAPAAMAIGPRSLVDRAFVVWDLQKELLLGASYDFLRRVSVASPLHFPQTSNQGPSVDQLTSLAGSVVVRPYPLYTGAGFGTPLPGGLTGDYTLYGVTYRKTNGSSGTFGPTAVVNRTAGGAMPPPIFVAASWVTPMLHMVFYLTVPTIPIPTSRYPLTWTGALPMGTVARGEQLGAMIPIHGRRVVNISITPLGTNANIRVSVLRGSNGGIAVGEARETDVFSSAGVVANTQVSTTLTNPLADYLLVYGNPLTVDSVDGSITVIAYD